MNKVVIFCKSYRGDVDRVKVQFESISKHNRDDIPYYISSNLKLKKIYKWTTKHNLDEILQKTFIQLILKVQKKILLIMIII